ncbi:hypothetical protein KGQ24_02325 [Patescibacteria group bacterium]|nr:hypothetical protein [Patescibacteria group bacterium]
MLNKKAAIIIMAMVIVAMIAAVIYLNNRISNRYPAPAQQQNQQSQLPNVSENSQSQQNAAEQNSSISNLRGGALSSGSTAQPIQQQPQQSSPQTSGNTNAPAQSTGSQSAASGSGSSTQNQPAINIPVETGFDTSIFQIYPATDAASVLSYSNQLNAATANFDLIKNGGDIQKQFQSMDQKTLQSLSDQATSVAAAIKNIPVPQVALGMAERYYLLYTDYATIAGDVASLYDTSLTDQQRQQKIDEVNNTIQATFSITQGITGDLYTVQNLQ